MTLAFILIAAALAAAVVAARGKARAAQALADERFERIAALQSQLAELGGVRAERDRLRGDLDDVGRRAVDLIAAADGRAEAAQRELDDLRAKTERDELERLVGSTVVVHANDGRRIRGVLQGAHRDVLSLIDAEHIGGRGGTQAFTGVVHVPRSSEPFVQQLPPAAGGEIRQLGED